LKYTIYQWLEEYLFYKKTISQKILSFLLFPISLIYGSIVFIKRKLNPPKNMNIPIVSIGNLSMGGNGKTPLCIAIAKAINKPVTIILRGYKRKSKGLLVVSIQGKILCSVEQSGDEAMLMAQRLSFANVIVSADRLEAIKLAPKEKTQYILLDDGFSKSYIEKYDILIQPKEFSKLNKRVLPSGSFREFNFTKKYANKIAVEEKDFVKTIHMPTLKDIQATTLITSISKPQRLDKDLPNDINKVYFSDHHFFSKQDIYEVIAKHKTKTLLMTKKDFVKIQDLKLENIDIEIIYLQVKISQEFENEIKSYINNYKK